MVMKKRISAIYIILIGSIILGCTSQDAKYTQTPVPQGSALPTPLPLPPLTPENFPLMDGSTSTFPLDTWIACDLLDITCEWMEWFDGTKYPAPNLMGIETGFPEIVHNGTHSAYVNLINGDADLILVARLPSLDELDMAESMWVELDPVAIALDAFVIILNKDNPVDDLTTREIQGIYTGAITNWSKLGGGDAEINPYQRNDNSGSQELMKSLVMRGLTMIGAPDMMLPTMLAPINAISDDVDGIGYSVFYYEQAMAPNERLKLCGVDGVVPDSKSIQSKTYPFTTEVYAVVRQDEPRDSIAYRLRAWLLSTAGQEVVASSGYVPLR
jgi:phosphate transport system substrate-binding protein